MTSPPRMRSAPLRGRRDHLLRLTLSSPWAHMEIRTLMDAFGEFERKDKKDTCPVLEQYLCHIAKTGQPVLPWSQFKAYFMFKLEKVMDTFRASAPQQRGQHNPNVDDIPFEQMKERILKIVDDFHGIPFTIQRLCELLTDPKRNYTGIDKFLLGLEKNVMVVSCISSTSDQNVDRSQTQNVLNRPKISSCDSCSRNGFPDSPGDKKTVLIREELKEHFIRDSSPPGGGIMSNCRLKNRQPEQEADDEKQEIKRLKFDEKKEIEHEDKDSPCNLSENLESSEGTSHQGNKNTTSEDQGSTLAGPSEDNEISCETRLHSVKSEARVDQQKQPASPGTSSIFEYQNVESCCSSDSKELPCDSQVPSTSSSIDSPTEGDTGNSDSTMTGKEPVDQL